jgi:hypothetical protein
MLKLNIDNHGITYIGLIGTVPILLSGIFNIACNIWLGFDKNGYTSLGHFFQTDNVFLEHAYSIANPFVLWQIALVGFLMMRITSRNKSWLMFAYMLMFVIVRIVAG